MASVNAAIVACPCPLLRALKPAAKVYTLGVDGESRDAARY